jgi:hypothetical protein
MLRESSSIRVYSKAVNNNINKGELKMGDYYSKINQVENSGMHHIIRLFKMAKEYGWSSEKLNNEYLTYRKQININKYPRYVSSYLQGVRDTLTAQIQFSDLEFCYIVEGVKYSTRKDSDMYYEKHGIRPSELHKQASVCGHYWIENGNAYYESPVND